MVDEMAPSQYGGVVGSYLIYFRARWCDCDEFQTCHFSCHYVITACAFIYIHWQEYRDNVYKLETIFNVYRKEFQVMSNEGHWNPYNSPRLCPDFTMQNL